MSVLSNGLSIISRNICPNMMNTICLDVHCLLVAVYNNYPKVKKDN